MRLRWVGLFLSCASTLACVAPVHANEKAEPDPAQSTYWEPIRKIMFGDREILDGKDVLRVYLPLRADDASTVPVTVKAQIEQHGVLRQEFAAHCDVLQRRLRRALFGGAARLPVTERNPSGAPGARKYERPGARTKSQAREVHRTALDWPRCGTS